MGSTIRLSFYKRRKRGVPYSVLSQNMKNRVHQAGRLCGSSQGGHRPALPLGASITEGAVSFQRARPALRLDGDGFDHRADPGGCDQHTQVVGKLGRDMALTGVARVCRSRLVGDVRFVALLVRLETDCPQQMGLRRKRQPSQD